MVAPFPQMHLKQLQTKVHYKFEYTEDYQKHTITVNNV